MLGEVKRRDDIQARIRQRPQITQRLTFLNIEVQLFTLLDQDAIGIDAARLKSVFTKHLEPLAAPATDVEYVRIETRLFQHRQVNFHFLFDLFGRTTQYIFEREVE